MEPLNLPITGICFLVNIRFAQTLDKLDADIAVLGVPCDFGVGFMRRREAGSPQNQRSIHTVWPRHRWIL